MGSKYQFRSATQYGFDLDGSRIDKEKDMLYGVTAMMSGVEATGHGVMADLTTLQMMAELGNANPKGIRGRFGHPAMSENATGKQVQVADNFSVVGNKLVHDSDLLSSARKSPAFSRDPVDFIMHVAEFHPTEFGESVVVSADTVWTLEDGREMPVVVYWPGEYGYPDLTGFRDVEFDNEDRPTTATTDLPVMRPYTFHYVDFVNEGALTHDGMFSVAEEVFAGHSSEYAIQLFALVDEWRKRYQIPLSEIGGKVEQLTAKYISSRQHKGDSIMPKRQPLGDKRRQRRFEADDNVAVVGEDGSVEEVFETDEELKDDGAVLSADEDGEELDGEELDGEEDEVDLSELHAMADSLSTSLQAQEDRPATMGHILDLQADFANMNQALLQLGAENKALRQQIGEMKALMKQSLSAMTALGRNVQRIDGERVVTRRVSSTPEEQLEPMFEQPSPGREFSAASPTHYSKRNGQKPVSGKAGILQRNLQRQQYIMGAGGK